MYLRMSDLAGSYSGQREGESEDAFFQRMRASQAQERFRRARAKADGTPLEIEPTFSDKPLDAGFASEGRPGASSAQAVTRPAARPAASRRRVYAQPEPRVQPSPAGAADASAAGTIVDAIFSPIANLFSNLFLSDPGPKSAPRASLLDSFTKPLTLDVPEANRDVRETTRAAIEPLRDRPSAQRLDQLRQRREEAARTKAELEESRRLREEHLARERKHRAAEERASRKAAMEEVQRQIDQINASATARQVSVPTTSFIDQYTRILNDRPVITARPAPAPAPTPPTVPTSDLEAARRALISTASVDWSRYDALKNARQRTPAPQLAPRPRVATADRVETRPRQPVQYAPRPAVPPPRPVTHGSTYGYPSTNNMPVAAPRPAGYATQYQTPTARGGLVVARGPAAAPTTSTRVAAGFYGLGGMERF